MTGKSLREQVKELENKLRLSETTQAKTQDEARVWTDQKEKLLDTVELYKSQNSRLEDSLNKATEEINKGNDIIRRLQNDFKAMKSKMKLKNVMTLQQEKLLDERSGQIETLRGDLDEVKAELKKKEEENESLHEKVGELEKKVGESKKVIDDNNHSKSFIYYLFIISKNVSNEVYS